MPENLKQRLINPLTLSIAAVAMPAMILIAALAINGSRASSAAGTTAGAPVVNDVILAQTDEPPADTPGIAATTETAGPAEAASTGEAPGAAPAAPQEGKLNIVGMVPLPGHKLESQIVLFFDHEIVLPLSPEGTPVQPFRIEPELEGDFQTGPNYVAFTLAPNQDLPPNEYYDVRVDRDIRSEDGRELNPGQTDLRVATFAFEPQRIWLLEKNEDRTVLGILFPVEVDLGAFREHLEVADGSDKEIPFTLERGTSELSFRLSVDASAETPLKLNVKAGLEDSAAQFTLARDRVFTYPVDPFFHVTEVKWGGKSKAWRDVLITFSKPVRGEDLRWHAIFTHMPDDERIGFDVPDRGANTSHRVRLMKEGDIGAVRVALSVDLPGENETRLVEGYSEILPPAPEPLRVTGTQWGPSDNRNYVLFIRFSSPVSHEDLAEHLTIVDEQTGAQLEYTVDTREVEDSHRVRFRHPSPDGPRISLELSDGLVAPDKSVLLESFTTSLSWSPPKLFFEHVSPGTKGVDGIVVGIRLNKIISVGDLEKHLEVSPDVGEIRVVAGSRGYYTLYGKWRMQVPYELRILPGVEFPDGSVSTDAVAHQFTIKNVRPVLDFSHPGKYYFTMREGSPLSVLSLGLHDAQVTVHRIFPSNLVYALGDLTDETKRDPYEYRRRDPVDETIVQWSEELQEKQLALVHSPDEVAQTNLDLNEWFPPDKRGIFCLVAEYKTPGIHLRANKLVMLTNIGILSHWQDDNIVLFAHNLFTLSPLERARVSIYSTKKQLLHMGTTDARGVFQAGNFDPDLGPPQLAVVEYENDAAFLELNPRKDDTPAIKPGMPLYDSEEYDGFLYADRDLYRPGETVHLRWVVRTNFGDALANVPLEFLISGPRGKVVHPRPTTLSRFGTEGFDFVTEKTHPTGQYVVELRLPGGHTPPIGSYRFMLEDFVPNRLKTIVELPAKEMLPDTEYPILVKAEHLFGASAADRKSACEVVIEKGDWTPEAWPGYRFSNETPFTPDRVNCGEQQTDEGGNAGYTFSYIPSADATFPLQARAIGRVFELGGRVVTETADAMFFPSDICLGVRANEPPAGDGVEIHVAAVKPDGSPADLASVKVTLERQAWNYYIRRYYSHYESNWTDSYEEIETRDVPLERGRGTAVMDVKGYGRYRLRVHSESTPQFSTLTFRSYWYGGRLSFGDTARPTLIKLSLDKQTYRPGDEAIVLVESPFDGRGLLVVQGERIREMIPFAIEDNKAEVRVPVRAENVPNLWIEVTALHEVKTERAQVYPFSSFAMIPLLVDNLDRELRVEFPGLPEEIRPSTEARFEIRVQDGNGNPAQAELTLAAVDEGIHAITDYQTPNPCGHFSRPRQPDYRRAHYYDKVAYVFDKPGFGGGAELKKRALTIGENWIKPVALWSGVVETDAEGKATISMAVPEFTGQLRLVAVACSTTASGAGSENVFVRRPFVLRTSMPRFMLPGDMADCAAVVFNTTDQAAQAVLSWSASGPLAADGAEQRVELPAKGEARVAARFTAAQGIGQAHISWRAIVTDARGNQLEDLVQEAPMPIRPSSGYQSDHEFVVLDPGQTRTFTNERFLENEWTERELSVTADPTSRLEPALRYLMHYPYGCIEQAVSRLMPMYLLRSSSNMAGRTLGDGQELNTSIEAGIQRLFSMQTPNGGLSCWPGGYRSYPYGSLYALHFLTLVKNDREFAVPSAPYQGLQRYARTIAADWSDDSPSHLYQRAYALYVLTLGGDLEAVKQIRRFDTIDMPQPGRYLLAAALARATHDADRVKMYLSEMPSAPYEVVEQTATLSSDIRNTAVELMALRQMGGDPDEIHRRAETLIRFLEWRRRGNTQENAFAITALCEYLGELAAVLNNPSATVVGPSGAKLISGREMYSKHHQGQGGEYTVTNTGLSPMFINLTTQGFLAEPDLTPVREGVGVERVILTKEGTPHEGDEFRQTETYIVHLTIHADRRRDNLVVVDMLPAGFEIENPRLTKDLPQLKAEARVTPSYTDIRDDRIILAFGYILQGAYHYHYVVRAVTPGVFQYPAAAAECMYDAEVHGSSAPATVTVSRAE